MVPQPGLCPLERNELIIKVVAEIDVQQCRLMGKARTLGSVGVKFGLGPFLSVALVLVASLSEPQFCNSKARILIPPVLGSSEDEMG